MRERLIELRERRARLLERANGERETLAAYLARADAATRWVETGRLLVASLRRRPLWVAAAVVLLVALRPRRVLTWLAKGWTLWQLYRQARLWWQRLAPLAQAALRRPVGA